MTLIEREPLLASLRLRLPLVLAGRGQLVWVAGEAGAGKTTAVGAFCDSLDSDLTVWWGACDPLTTARPLGPVQDIAVDGTELASAIGRRPPHEVFRLVRRQLQHGAGPVVFVVEDAHWADGATCDLLRYLGRRLTGLSALLLVTYRDDEVGPEHPLRVVLGDLASAPGVSRLHVPALTRDGVIGLATDHGLDGADVYEMTGGNAFFVSEVVAAPHDRLPQTVSDAVLARAARLPTLARAALDAASVSPVAVEPWLVDEAAGTAGSDLDECVTSGLLVPDAQRLRFRHEIARLAVQSALPPGRRQHLHRRMLQLLAARSHPDAARLAHHALGWGDAEAILEHASSAAAAAVSMGAHREAAEHYRAILMLEHAVSAGERAELCERLSYEYYLIGRPDEAVAGREEALRLARAAGDLRRVGDNLRWLSRLLWFLGRNEQAERHGNEAVAVLEALPRGRELAMAYSNMSQLAMLRAAYDDAHVWGNKALTLAEELSATEVICHALNNLGTARYSVGDPQGREELERSLALALDNGLEEHAARAYTNLLSVAVSRRDLGAADSTAALALAYCRERDLDSWTMYMTSWVGRLALLTDDWDRAEQAATTVLTRPGVAPVNTINAQAVLARVQARRGQPGAQDLAQLAVTSALQTREPQRLVVSLTALAEVTWLRGDALPLALHPELSLATTGIPWEDGELAVWAMRHGVPVSAPSADDVPYTQSLRGAHEAAAQAWLARGCRYEAALSAVDGTDPDLVRRGLDWLRQLGADGVLERATTRLRELGLRGPRPSTSHHPGGLTYRETEVLELLATGRSNSAIAAVLVVSKRTVDHHVSAILRKLDVTTRAEAVRRAQQLPGQRRP